MRGHGARPIAVLAGMLHALAMGCVTPLHQVRWTILETPRFEILTTLSEHEAKALAGEIELIDALIRRMTGLVRAEHAVATRIIALARPTQLPQLRHVEASGLLSVGMRSTVILSFAPAPRRSYVSERVLHQYVHYLLRDESMRPLPYWYEEGLAAVLSGAREREDRVVIGDLPRYPRSRLKPQDASPIEELILVEPNDRLAPEERRLFQIQSWALVRHLMLERSGASGANLSRYLDLVELGIEPRSAFSAAFGLSTADAETDIRRALEDERLDVVEIPVRELALDGEVRSVRAADASEVALALGELLLLADDPVAAEREFRAAIARDARDHRAHAGLGVALRHQGRVADAEEAHRRAVELDPDDPLAHLDLGLHFETLARSTDTLEAMQRELDRARLHYEEAQALDGERPETEARLGTSYLFPGEDPEIALGHLRRAYANHPASIEIVVALAEAHLARGDELAARDLLRRTRSACGDPSADPAAAVSTWTIRARRDAMAKKVRLDEARVHSGP